MFAAITESTANHVTRDAAGAAVHFEPIDFWADLFRLMIFLSAVFLAGKAVQLLGGPSLIGEILAGILLGPHIANFAPEPRSLILLGDFGLCLLMLEAGLEIDVSLLKQVGPRGLVIALTGTALPFSIGFGIATAFKFSFKGAFAAGAALQPTSLAIVLGVLKKGGTLNTPTGQLIVAAAAIDDVIAVILLSEVQALENPTVFGFLIPVISAIGFLVVIGGVAVFVIPPVLSNIILPKVPPQHREHVVLGLILVTAIGLQSAAAAARSSYLLGALLAGLSFSTIRASEHVWELQVKRLLHWVIKIFFAATIGFEVPIRSFWSRDVLYQSAAFLVPVVVKLVVGWYAVPITTSNVLTVGVAMCARGEFGFIIALQARTLHFFTEKQYASIVLPVLLAAIIVPFSLKIIISQATRKGLAIFDEAEYDTHEDAATKFKPVYYQMRLKCANSWGLMSEILSTASANKLQVIDARIHSVGKVADDVFYFKDLELRAPVRANAGDEAAQKVLKEVQDRLDDLYEAFLQMARTVTASVSQGPSQPSLTKRLSLDLMSRTRSGGQEGGRGDGDTSQTDVDLTFIRWLPGMVDTDAIEADDGDLSYESDFTDSVVFKAIMKQMDKDNLHDAGDKAVTGLGNNKSAFSGDHSAMKSTSSFFAPNPVGRRASIEMLIGADMSSQSDGGKASADTQIREGLVYNAARDLEKFSARQNKHAGFSKLVPRQYEKAIEEESAGYSRRSIDLRL